MNISEHTPPRILALMAITGALAAQTPTWQQLAAWPAPSPRANLPMAYDCMRHCAVVVGGQFGYGTHFADTWEFDGAVWTQRQPAIQPPVRAMAAMAYDERARRCLLFGGATPAPGFGFGPRRNDTWLWGSA